jgi:hypothetical protein
METNIETIIINGRTYYSEKPAHAEFNGSEKIIILQRGWVMVGILERNGSECKLHNASVIRTWGTSKGLGEIAMNGPTKDTKLDPCGGIVEFDYLTVVASLSVNKEKWKL